MEHSFFANGTLEPGKEEKLNMSSRKIIMRGEKRVQLMVEL